MSNYEIAKVTFLGNFVLSNSMTSVGNFAFMKVTFCGDFTLENTQVENIGDYAFFGAVLPIGFTLELMPLQICK